MLGNIPSNEIPAWENPLTMAWYSPTFLYFSHAGMKYLISGCCNLLGNQWNDFHACVGSPCFVTRVVSCVDGYFTDVGGSKLYRGF